MNERDLIERLRARRKCQRCDCLSCGREGMGELHDHVCTDGPDCIETREKLRAKNRNLRLLCGDAADALRDREATIARLSEALAEAEKKGGAARAERDGVLYAFHHRLFSEVGLSYPNDGVSVCTGLKLDALAAAKTLREMGLVTIRNSGAGPLVTWADGRGLPAPPRDLSQGGQHG